jgi:hypothetical protein
VVSFICSPDAQGNTGPAGLANRPGRRVIWASSRSSLEEVPQSLYVVLDIVSPGTAFDAGFRPGNVPDRHVVVQRPIRDAERLGHVVQCQQTGTTPQILLFHDHKTSLSYLVTIRAFYPTIVNHFLCAAEGDWIMSELLDTQLQFAPAGWNIRNEP